MVGGAYLPPCNRYTVTTRMNIGDTDFQTVTSTVTTGSNRYNTAVTSYRRRPKGRAKLSSARREPAKLSYCSISRRAEDSQDSPTLPASVITSATRFGIPRCNGGMQAGKACRRNIGTGQWGQESPIEPPRIFGSEVGWRRGWSQRS